MERKNACSLPVIVLLFLVFALHASSAIHSSQHLSPRVVTTKYGSLRGVVINLSSRGLGDAEVFLGIPYATPPIGNLRFMPPGSPSLWTDIKVANTMRPVCPQKLPDIRNETEALDRMSRIRFLQLKRLLPYLQNQSEDCLHLNIFTPSGGK
ncbi:UNVERIFIED_CONTAM: hypothetical protein GTU68_031973 [Idotea baltica]|nr:hypothetical protein [Idotea baltica]